MLDRESKESQMLFYYLVIGYICMCYSRERKRSIWKSF